MKEYSFKEAIIKSKENQQNNQQLKIFEELIQNSKRENLDQLVKDCFNYIRENKNNEDELNQLEKQLSKYLTQNYQPLPKIVKILFFPSLESEEELLKVLDMAQKKIRICIFTLTNNKLSELIYIKHKMGLDIKIISDDQMGKMLGSDLQDLSNCGIPVRYDSDPHAHMHHKFCLIDDHIIINGSFNWTVQAVKKNNENLIIQHNPYFVQQFDQEFDRLWLLFQQNQLSNNSQVHPHFIKAFEDYQNKDNLEYQQLNNPQKKPKATKKIVKEKEVKQKKTSNKDNNIKQTKAIKTLKEEVIKPAKQKQVKKKTAVNKKESDEIDDESFDDYESGSGSEFIAEEEQISEEWNEKAKKVVKKQTRVKKTKKQIEDFSEEEKLTE